MKSMFKYFHLMAIVALLGSPLFAQPHPAKHSWQLATELQKILTAEQKSALFAKLDEMPPPPHRGAPGAHQGGNARRGNRANRNRRPHENEGLGFLTAEQRQQLHQNLQRTQHEERMAAMVEALQLNPNQANALNRLHQEMQTQREEMHNQMQNDGVNKEELRTKMENHRQNHKTEIERILNPNQLELFKIHQALQMQHKRGHQRPERGNEDRPEHGNEDRPDRPRRNRRN